MPKDSSVGEFTQEEIAASAAEKSIQNLSAACYLLDSLTESDLRSLPLDQRSRLFSSVLHCGSLSHRLKNIVKEHPDFLRPPKIKKSNDLDEEDILVEIGDIPGEVKIADYSGTYVLKKGGK